MSDIANEARTSLATTPEEDLYQLFGATLRHLKSLIKADALAIRVLKTETRRLLKEKSNKGSLSQSDLYRLRLGSRCRLLAYGLARGRNFAIMESNHPEGVPNLAREIERQWNLALKEAAGDSGLKISLTEATQIAQRRVSSEST